MQAASYSLERWVGGRIANFWGKQELDTVAGCVLSINKNNLFGQPVLGVND